VRHRLDAPPRETNPILRLRIADFGLRIQRGLRPAAWAYAGRLYKQDAHDKSRRAGFRPAFPGRYRRSGQLNQTFVGCVKQTQFAWRGRADLPRPSTLRPRPRPADCAKQDAHDKSPQTPIRAAFLGQYPGSARPIPTFVVRVKQTQFGTTGRMCDIASMPRFGKQSRLGRSQSCETNPVPAIMPIRRSAFPGGQSCDIASMPRFGKRSQFAILRPARWTRQPPPYAGHTPMRRRLGYRLIGWERCAEKKPASLLAGGRTRRTRDVRPPWCVA
jgi:hypothetical protein